MAKKNHKKQQKQQKKKEVIFECPGCGDCCIYTMPCFDDKEMNRVKRTITTKPVKFKKYTFDRSFKGGKPHVGYAYLTENGYHKLELFVKIQNDLAAKGTLTKENLEAEFRKLPLPPCEFLKIDQDRTWCTIYPIRPDVCKQYMCPKCHRNVKDVPQ